MRALWLIVAALNPRCFASKVWLPLWRRISVGRATEAFVLGGIKILRRSPT